MLASASSTVSLTYLSGKSLEESSPIFIFTAIHCMDLDSLGHGPSGRRKVSSNPSIPYSDPIESSERGRWHPHSNPLPQTQWADVSSSRRPQYQPGTGQEQRHGAPRATSAHCVYTPWNPDDAQSTRKSTDFRKRSRGRRFHELLLWGDDETEDEPPAVYTPSQYPQMSPYNNRLSTYSAQDELERHETRSMTQSSGLGYVFLSSPDDPSPISFPRSPTYHPTVRRRVQNATAVDDAALVDAEEFHLFVQAIAGLGPEDAFPGVDPYPNLSRGRQRIVPRAPIRHTTSPEIVSPIEESSMTIQAMRQLAQMPDGSQSYLSTFDLQSQPFGATDVVSEVSPLEGFDDFEDELPDYEESQAQAHARQRTEAARRAQELQRRWRQTGSRRGI